MTTLTQPEPWLRGPVDGFEPLLMPVVHAFIQAREDVGHLVARVPAEHTRRRETRTSAGTSRRRGRRPGRLTVGSSQASRGAGSA